MRQILLLVLGVALGACSTIEPSPSESATIAPDGDSLAGAITFGSAEHSEAAFRLNEEVGWTAVLSSPVEDTKINIVITERGGDTELFGYEQFITYPGATILQNRMPLGRFLPEPGAYVMRYVSLAGVVLAEGEFQLRR